MKLINFSFKAEPVWMLVLPLIPTALVLLVLMILWLLR